VFITIVFMSQADVEKSVRQYIEMESFFSGGFCVVNRDQVREAADMSRQNAAIELTKLSDQIKSCELCELCKSRNKAVPGCGSCSANLVFVGEGPGADEDAQGLPFVGRAGKLLDKMIAGMGLNRDDVFICNVVKCRPPGNRDPKAEEILSCFPYLKAQLDVICPDVIVALGAHAARTLLNTNRAIGELRGTVHEFYVSEDSEPIPLIATYHPAYLLRNYTRDARTKVWHDLQKAMGIMGLEVKGK
jgi:DNA polymerase